MSMWTKKWRGIGQISSRKYKCGYCNSEVASEKGWDLQADSDFFPSRSNIVGAIHVCPHCEYPTFFKDDEQIPMPFFGSDVKHISSKEVESLYNEARACMAVTAFTAAVLCCRKLLMNIAVSKGAKTNEKFIVYVEYLDSKGFIPPDGKEWVDQIRKKGNEATHEIQLMDKRDAENLLTFMEMLLKFIYEFPNMLPKKPNVAP